MNKECDRVCPLFVFVISVTVLIFIFTVISCSEGVLNQLNNATRSVPYLEVCLRFEDCTPSETEMTWKQQQRSDETGKGTTW